MRNVTEFVTGWVSGEEKWSAVLCHAEWLKNAYLISFVSSGRFVSYNNRHGLLKINFTWYLELELIKIHL